MRRHNLDVILAIIVVILNVGWLLLPMSQPIVGLLLALPLLFFIPGYLLTAVLLQGISLDVAHRVLLSLVMSVCIVLLSGFLLNLLPGGLNTRSWSIYLSGLSTLLGLLVMLRRWRNVIYRIPAWNMRLKFSGSILLGLALVIIGVSVYYSAMSVTNQPRPGFTQLWLLPSKDVNHTWQLKLGVHSDELAPVTYNITMSVNHTLFKSWSSITLNPKQEWDQSVLLPTASSNRTYVQVEFYYANKTGIIYKELHNTLAG